MLHLNDPPHDKTNKMTVRPAKTQSDKSSLCAQWVAKDPCFLHADSEDSDQTGRMPRLICVFAGRTCHFVCYVMRRLKYIITFFFTSLAFSKLRIFSYSMVLQACCKLPTFSKKLNQGRLLSSFLSMVVQYEPPCLKMLQRIRSDLGFLKNILTILLLSWQQCLGYYNPILHGKNPDGVHSSVVTGPDPEPLKLVGL